MAWGGREFVAERGAAGGRSETGCADARLLPAGSTSIAVRFGPHFTAAGPMGSSACHVGASMTPLAYRPREA